MAVRRLATLYLGIDVRLALTHFDALHIGLTATPAAYIERNTFDFYHCKDGQPDIAYPIQEAFKEGHLVCEPTGQRDPRDQPQVVFRYVDISSIDRERKIISGPVELLGSEAPSRARKEIRSGDVLVSTVRPNLNAVAIVPDDLDGQIASTGFCVLRAKKETIVPQYLFRFCQTTQFVESLSTRVRGAHYPAVSDSAIKEMEVPLPPLSEQRRIVHILDQADTIRKLPELQFPVMTYLGKGNALVRLGRFAEAERLLQDALAVATREGALGYQAELTPMQGQICWKVLTSEQVYEPYPARVM
jgi:hypothetical protein